MNKGFQFRNIPQCKNIKISRRKMLNCHYRITISKKRLNGKHVMHYTLCLLKPHCLGLSTKCLKKMHFLCTTLYNFLKLLTRKLLDIKIVAQLIYWLVIACQLETGLLTHFHYFFFYMHFNTKEYILHKSQVYTIDILYGR